MFNIKEINEEINFEENKIKEAIDTITRKNWVLEYEPTINKFLDFINKTTLEGKFNWVFSSVFKCGLQPEDLDDEDGEDFVAYRCIQLLYSRDNDKVELYVESVEDYNSSYCIDVTDYEFAKILRSKVIW